MLVARAKSDLGYTPVNKAGDTMTGPLQHVSQGIGVVTTYRDSGNTVNRYYQAHSDTSWSLNAMNDAGSFLGTLVQFTRSTLAASFGGNVTGGQFTSSDGGGVNAFIGSGTTVALACSNSGGVVILRPNGAASSTNQATYSTGGNLAISGTGTGVNWIGTSDERLKANIRYGQPSGVVDAIDWWTWEWAEGTARAREEDEGVVAQRL